MFSIYIRSMEVRESEIVSSGTLVFPGHLLGTAAGAPDQTLGRVLSIYLPPNASFRDIGCRFWLSLTPFLTSVAPLGHVTFCRFFCHRPCGLSNVAHIPFTKNSPPSPPLSTRQKPLPSTACGSLPDNGVASIIMEFLSLIKRRWPLPFSSTFARESTGEHHLILDPLGLPGATRTKRTTAWAY